MFLSSFSWVVGGRLTDTKKAEPLVGPSLPFSTTPFGGLSLAFSPTPLFRPRRTLVSTIVWEALGRTDLDRRTWTEKYINGRIWTEGHGQIDMNRPAGTDGPGRTDMDGLRWTDGPGRTELDGRTAEIGRRSWRRIRCRKCCRFFSPIFVHAKTLPICLLKGEPNHCRLFVTKTLPICCCRLFFHDKRNEIHSLLMKQTRQQKIGSVLVAQNRQWFGIPFKQQIGSVLA